MAPSGRLIYDEDYEIEKWNKRDGLWFRNPKGELVNTHIDRYCPMLGPGPRFIPDGELAAAVTELTTAAIDDGVEEIEDVADYMAEECEKSIEDLLTELHDIVRETSSSVPAAARVKEEPDVTENLRKFEFIVDDARALRGVTKELVETGCPVESEILYRTSVNMDDGEVWRTKRITRA